MQNSKRGANLKLKSKKKKMINTLLKKKFNDK